MDSVPIAEAIEKVRRLLEEESISPSFKAAIELLLVIVTLLAGRFGLNSRNSHTPPSADPNRDKDKKAQGTKKPGGQVGRLGVNLKPVKDPDEIIEIEMPKEQLPIGNYFDAGFEARQIIDFKISRFVTEYRAKILKNEKGKKFTAPFPKSLLRPIQYGQSIKAHAVYLSQFQLIPYERVGDYFIHQAKVPVSVGSLFNFNNEAYELLEEFDALAKERLVHAALLHADETGININGKRQWLHNASNEKWTYLYPYDKRGSDAMNEIGILPKFRGIMVHDHWKPYYKYEQCSHALCNAHHLRELQWVIDHTDFVWAKNMQDLLLETNEAKKEHGVMGAVEAKRVREKYQKILADGLLEMPSMAIPEVSGKKKRGRAKKTKELNLLERLRDYENDVLRFIELNFVPFTNNRGENDIRMTKVQQKISGCFKSLEGAKIFCRVRSYLLTAQKHDISAAEALKILFEGKLPDIFFNDALDIII